MILNEGGGRVLTLPRSGVGIGLGLSFMIKGSGWKERGKSRAWLCP